MLNLSEDTCKIVIALREKRAAAGCCCDRLQFTVVHAAILLVADADRIDDSLSLERAIDCIAAQYAAGGVLPVSQQNDRVASLIRREGVIPRRSGSTVGP